MHITEKDGFHLLWPMLFMQRTLPGHEPANIEFERIILERDAAHRDMTTDYADQNLFSTETPVVDWLRQCIHKSAVDYCQRAGVDYPVNWTLHGWANVNRLGDYHDPHNHPYAYLSGTYYVSVPESRAPLQNRSDVRPGCITFYDPRNAVNMTAIKGDPQVDPEFTVTPRPGMILLWPSFLMHYVHPNLSEDPRISVSFNLMVKDPTDYMPEQ